MPVETLSKARATLVRALHRRKGRREHRAFLAEGERTLEELARGGATVRFTFGRERQLERLATLLPDAPAFVIDERLDALFATENAQGLAAVVEMPRALPIDDLDRMDGSLLVLDAVADPGNVGTIIRSAEWFSVAGVVLLPGCADPFNPKSVRASMGSLVRVPLAEATLDELLQIGRPLLALDAGGSRTLGRDRLPRSGAFVVGSEAHGISVEVAARAQSVSIAGRGSVESLNAAIAASILLYELSRSALSPGGE